MSNPAHKVAESAGLLGADTSPEQLDAFRDEKGQLPKDVFRLARQSDGGPEGKRGPGRPAGSKNKRSSDLSQLIEQQHGNPVLFMASLYSRPLDQVVELLKIADPGKDTKRGDIAIKALNVQLAAAKATAEYTDSKKAVEHKVDLGADAVIVMPGRGDGSFQEIDAETRASSEIIAKALFNGEIRPEDLMGMSLVNGALEYADYSEVDDASDGGSA